MIYIVNRKTFLDNAIKIWENHGQRFVWDYLNEIPELKTDWLFVKFGKHKKGEARITPKANKDLITISILIYGKLKISFPDENTEYIMEKEWDMVYYANNVNHTWEVLEDCLDICISFKR